MRARRNVKSGKMLKMFPSFSGGLNTSAALHQIHDAEFSEGTNVDIDEEGSASKRKGFTRIVASLGAGRVQGAYVFKKYTTKELLIVHNGKLYRFDTTNQYTLLGQGNWVEIPIRRHFPTLISVTVAATGTVGGAILANTTYVYTIVAKDASGTTLDSNNISGVQGATARPVDLVWDKVFGAINYDIYRGTGTGARKLLKANVGDVTTWSDTGADTPGAQDPPTFNTTRVTVPSSANVEFVTYNNMCFFTTGAGLCQYDSITASLVTPYTPTSVENTNVGLNSIRSVTSSIHKCTQIKLHVERIFVAGDPDFPQNFYWTDVGLSPSQPRMYFPVPYAADVSTSNGSPVTALHNFRDTLIVFTTDSIHCLFGMQPDETKPDPFILRPIQPDIGTLSNRSIVLVGNVLAFVSRRGVYALSNVVASNQYLNVQYLSEKIGPTFKNISRPDLAVAIYHDHQYKVCFPADGLVFRWYSQKQAWTLDTAPAASVYLAWDSDLYMASNTEGIVWKFGQKRVQDPGGLWTEADTYNDDGEIIPFYLRTRSFDMDADFNLKKFRQAFIAGKQYPTPTSVQVESIIDYLTTTQTFGFNESTYLGKWELAASKLGWVDVVYHPFRFKGKGHLAFFRLTNAVLDEPVTVYGMGVEYKVKSI